MRIFKVALRLTIASVLGLASVVIPAALTPNIEQYPSPLFPIVRTAVEGLSVPALVTLLIAGIGLGVFISGPPWLLGIATIALFPLLAIVEMAVDPSSHNLFPIEFTIYGLLTLPAIGGAYLGRCLRRRLIRTF